MIQNIKVTVAVPIYGVETYIERCAISLFEQSYDNIEYVFVNDCTKDNSISILENVINKYPNRKPYVKLINHEVNRGLGTARNTAIKNSSGDFIMWVDSDDFVSPTIVETAVQSQVNFNSDIITINYTNVYDNFSVKQYENHCSTGFEYCKGILLGTQSGRIWGRLIRRSLYINNKIQVKEGVNMGEDLQVSVKIFYYAKRVSFVDEHLYFYNCINDSSYSNCFSPHKLQQTLESCEIVYNFFQEKKVNMSYVHQFYLKTAIALLGYYGKNKNLDYYYEAAVSLLTDENMQYGNTLPYVKRSLLYIYKHKKLVKFYVLFLNNIRNLLRILSSLRDVKK